MVDDDPIEPDPDPTHPNESNWLDDSYPLCDADFIGDTLDRVLHDQSEIAAEAARVDEIHIDPDILRSYPAPSPSADFVDRTLARVLADRSGHGSDDDPALHDLLQTHVVPAPSAAFVDRTLAAVTAERAARTAPASLRHRFSQVAAVAAIVLCGVAVFWPESTTHAPPPLPAHVTEPVSFGTLINESGAVANAAIFPVPHGGPIDQDVRRRAAAMRSQEQTR